MKVIFNVTDGIGEIGTIMKKSVSKHHLPEKLCPVCERPFRWRKRWQKDWDNVKYCSERCRRNRVIRK